jgi:phosphoribosylanthranilate isomerase
LKPKWQKQFPAPRLIGDLFFNDPRVINLVHYSTEEGKENVILEDMLEIHKLAGSNLHGFQLNIPWPDVSLLKEYRADTRADTYIVLQIGQKAVEMVGDTPQGVVDALSHYVGFIDAILLDPSGGRGQPFNTARAREFLTAIAKQGWDISLGVAGGLGPDTLHLVEPLIPEFPELNIDAQGQLRDAEFNLDIEKMQTYLQKALRMFSHK